MRPPGRRAVAASALVMARASGLACLAGLLLTAPLRAEDSARDPAWVRGIEAANPYVSTAVDTLGAASDALSKTKDLKASQIALSEGNRAARQALAAEHNALRQSGLTAVKAAEKLNLGTATMAADVGGTLAGHLVEGDLRAVPGVVVNAAAKNVTSAGGAWAGGTAGAAIGSVAGPVGTLVGGVVGAAAGAVGMAWGYDATNAALEKRGLHSVQRYVDSLAAESPVDYVEKARAARREHQRAQADMQQRAENRKSGELPQFVEKAREARGEHLEEQKARREAANEWKEKQARRTEAAPATTAPPARTDIPVIPVDCTIDVVVWHDDAPSSKWKATFQLQGDTVTMRSEITIPGAEREGYRSGSSLYVIEFQGTRRDNVISGTSRDRQLPAKAEQWWNSTDAKGGSTRVHCVTEFSSQGTTTAEWTFLPGGQGTIRSTHSGQTTSHYSSGCVYKPGGSETRSYSVRDEGKSHFTWRIR